MTAGDLEQILQKPTVDERDLTPFLDTILRVDPSVPTDPPALTGVSGLFGSSLGTFADPAWRLYKRIWGPTWDKAGRFEGEPAVIARGGRDYLYRPGVPAFRFIRANGQEVAPGTMVTDGGSVPRLAWAIPGIDPWIYMPAYLIHDWDYMAHHCRTGYDRSFKEANDTLAEGIYTLMLNGVVPEDWRIVVAVHAAVSSFVGRKVWSREWSPDQCEACLNP